MKMPQPNATESIVVIRMNSHHGGEWANEIYVSDLFVLFMECVWHWLRFRIGINHTIQFEFDAEADALLQMDKFNFGHLTEEIWDNLFASAGRRKRNRRHKSPAHPASDIDIGKVSAGTAKTSFIFIRLPLNRMSFLLFVFVSFFCIFQVILFAAFFIRANYSVCSPASRTCRTLIFIRQSLM